MKPKKLRYLLGFGVVAVWGLILYRVIGALGGDDQPPLLAAQKLVITDETARADSFSLIADYPDPFLPDADIPDTKDSISTQPNVPATAATPPVVPKPAYVEGTVRYIGMIANPGKKMKIATITLEGKEFLVREKEKIDGYTIRRITPEKVELIYQGKLVNVFRNR